MAWSITAVLSTVPSDTHSLFHAPSHYSYPSLSTSQLKFTCLRLNTCCSLNSAQEPCFLPLQKKPLSRHLICRAAEYQFPDPIPEFAESETEKFKAHLVKKLSKKDVYGDSLDEVVGICTEIFENFMHTEYGGPGTLLVVPFIDMADTLTERGLPGAPQAARTAVKWAQKNVDKDWKEWTS